MGYSKDYEFAPFALHPETTGVLVVPKSAGAKLHGGTPALNIQCARRDPATHICIDELEGLIQLRDLLIAANLEQFIYTDAQWEQLRREHAAECELLGEGEPKTPSNEVPH